MYTLKIIWIVVSLIIVCRTVHAQDVFDAVRCGMDIPKALKGKVEPGGPVVSVERKHRDIRLKGEGGTEVSDNLFLSEWEICGSQYEMLIDKHRTIRDVLLFGHSRKVPGFLGTCTDSGGEVAGTILAVLNVPTPLNDEGHYSPDDTTLVPAISAWKIDEARAKFVAISPDSLRCPRNGVFTKDGGP